MRDHLRLVGVGLLGLAAGVGIAWLLLGTNWVLSWSDNPAYRAGFLDGRRNGRFLEARDGPPPILDRGHGLAELQGAQGWPQDGDEALARLANRAPSPCSERARRGRSLATDLVEGKCAARVAQIRFAAAVVRSFPDDPDEALAVLRVERRMPIDTEGRARKGPEDAAVVVVEWSDFQCPYCRRAMGIVERLLADHDDVAVVYKHLPLSFHGAAFAAAAASEAAGEQGRFWAMHDALFELGKGIGEGLPQGWDTRSMMAAVRDGAGAPSGAVPFEALAERLGLDVEAFVAAMRSELVLQRVLGDADEARRLGVSGTPTFLVGGMRPPGRSRAAFDEAVARARLEAAGRFVWDLPAAPDGLDEPEPPPGPAGE